MATIESHLMNDAEALLHLCERLLETKDPVIVNAPSSERLFRIRVARLRNSFQLLGMSAELQSGEGVYEVTGSKEPRNVT